ncbi:MAG: hypothetical protein JW910_16830 [Anaerolineae bacterium]|nr:hypothetical protein [Anaerolineae bacterium]
MVLALGKIVKSNAHTDYVCQIYGAGETDPVPGPESYALGTFVSVDLRSAGHLVGLVYDTVLLNPDFGRLGPRLSPETELAVFSPDYLSERAVLAGVTVIGHVGADGTVTQGVPLLAATGDALVEHMDPAQVRAFHRAPDGLNLSYLPLLVRGGNPLPLAQHLAQAVLAQLSDLLPEHQATLDVLADDLRWRSQIGPMGGVA